MGVTFRIHVDVSLDGDFKIDSSDETSAVSLSRAPTSVGKILTSGIVVAAGKMYYYLESPSALSTLNRLQAAAIQSKLGISPAALRVWLEEQDA